MRDREGNISESIVIHRDITERKRAQEALQIAHDELERRVEERTAELAEINEQLRCEIAERKHVAERLRESESRHRMLVENAPLGIIWCDLQGRVIQVNSNLLTILGSPSLEKIRAINVLTHPPLVEAGVSAEIRSCMESGPRVFECPYTSQWGKSAWLRLHMVPTRDNLSRTDGVQAIVEDITDRKQAQTELSESEERFRAVFEGAQDLIFLKNRDMVFTHVNPAYLKSLDLQESEVIGKTADQIFSNSRGHVRQGSRRARPRWTGGRGNLQLDSPWITQNFSMCQGPNAKFVRRNDWNLRYCPGRYRDKGFGKAVSTIGRTIQVHTYGVYSGASSACGTE